MQLLSPPYQKLHLHQAILTDLIKKSTTWHWGPQEQQAFDELKDKVANAKCLGVPGSHGEIIRVTDASNVGGGGTLFQWQALEKQGMLVLSSQSRLLGSNPVVWLCDQEPVRTFQKGPPPEKAKLNYGAGGPTSVNYG